GVGEGGVKRCEFARRGIGRPPGEKSDHRHRRLLRPCRELPRCRAAEQRDEVAPFHLCGHSMTSSASASSVGGISTPNAFAVARLMTSSNLAPTSTGRSPGFSPLETPADEAPGGAISVRLTGSVANKAASLGVLALIIHRRQGMPASERHELSALAEEEWTAAEEKPACTRLHDLCEGGMEFSLVGRVHHQDLVSDRTSRFLQVS